jgi:hypothetical protein
MSKSRKIVQFKKFDDSDKFILHKICEHTEKLLKQLEFCAKNKFRENTDRVITWIVNHSFEELLKVAIRKDQFVLNRLFATKENKHNGLFVAIDVFYEIQRRMENPFIAALLDVSDTDFQRLLTEVLPYSSIYLNYEDLIRYIILDYFESRHTNRLLAMLSRHVDFEIFDVIWRCVDDSNTVEVSEFLGNHLFYLKNLYDRLLLLPF